MKRMMMVIVFTFICCLFYLRQNAVAFRWNFPFQFTNRPTSWNVRSNFLFAPQMTITESAKERNSSLLFERWKRELFGDEQIQIVKAVPKGTFVNREEELVKVWGKLLSEYKLDRDKTTIIFLDQMFGSGKTTFGRNLLNFSNQRISDLYDSRILDENKNCLRQSYPIYIDINRVATDLEGIIGKSSFRSLSHFLSFVVFFETMMQLFPHYYFDANALLAFFQKNLSVSLRQCITFLKYITVSSSPSTNPASVPSLFFFFDEIKALEKGILNQLVTFNKRLEEDTLLLSLTKYYQFWEFLDELVKQKCFTIAAGKGHLIDLIGRKLFEELTSPGYALKLYLQSFSQYDISQILLADTSLQNCGDGEYLSQLSAYLHGISSGIPRLVVHAIEFLKESDRLHSLTTDDMKISSPLSEDILLFLSSINGLLPSFDSIPKEESKVFHAVLYAACAELPFQSDQRFPGVPEYTINQLANKYSLYLTKEKDYLKLIMPLLWRRFLKVGNIPFTLNIDPAYADKGKCLERVIQYSLMMRLTVMDKIQVSNALPFMKGSSLEGLIIPTLISHEYTKKFMKDENQHIPLFRQITQKFPSATLAIPLARGSSPDLTIIIKDEDNQSYVIAIQAKNLKDRRHLDATNIMKEYRKIKSHNDFFRFKKGIFIVVSTGGVHHSIETLAGKIISAATTVDEIGEIDQKILHSVQENLFPNIELLILNEPQLVEFLSMLNLRKLRELQG